ncbi:hypothetical protein G9A89_013733 [Geosiphon pyriformis]|nr:hypothetical protein G9A89_013733 [Geosiphon pyriformis]
MLSYSVVVYKLYGIPQLDREYFQRLNTDENLFYLGLAVCWWFNPPILVTPIPYATFSLFHLITYFRSNIIPTFVPEAAPLLINSNAPVSGNAKIFVDLSKGLQNWVLKNYEGAMRSVSFAEVAIITSGLVAYIITWKIRLITLFFYLLFLRFRYHMNPFTKLAFKNVSERLDQVFLAPSAETRIPRYVKIAYRQIKGLLVYAGQINTPPPPTRR